MSRDVNKKSATCGCTFGPIVFKPQMRPESLYAVMREAVATELELHASMTGIQESKCPIQFCT